VHQSTGLTWDDLRYALCVSNEGSLARAAKVLGVDHTTVGRRVEAAERALGVRLFLRASTGYTLTPDGERLLAPMRAVEAAVHTVTRAAEARSEGLTGLVRVTSPETFGVSWLAPQLAAFGLHHPGVNVELTPSGKVLDLGRGEAEIAVRFHRSRTQNLVVQRVAEVGYGLYASHAYLAEHPLPTPDDLRAQRLLLPPGRSIEGDWVARWAPGVRPAFASELSVALLAAARADAGVAVLPRYLGDPEAALCRIPLPDPPSEPVWLTVHEDLRDAPRVRAVLAFLGERLRAARVVLRGEAAAAV